MANKTPKPPADETQRLLSQLADVPQKLFTAPFRQQYAALCFRTAHGEGDLEVLTITSRRSGRWVIPKGSPMKDKKPHEVAATEAWEEAGIRGTVRKRPIGRYTYLKPLDQADVVPYIVDVFQIDVTGTEGTYKEKGERLLEWVPVAEAARRVREPELKSLLLGFKPRKSSKS
jgi:8-oxo-dGTP pyrophosphatase MutT (NUDIX family)